MNYVCPCCKLPKSETEWRLRSGQNRRTPYCIECTRAKDRARMKKRITTVEWKLYHADWLNAHPRAGVVKRGVREDGKKIRRAVLKVQTPAWAKQEQIKLIYDWAKNLSKDGVKYVVDHDIPLRGMLVSGLHVPENLRILTYDANRRKHRFYRSA